ncbi:TetR/AcrR family transcriptional regulator [Lolliginicoccus levis]|uniref:TetR/AcrR family transcriptional regulator n=1 Tax=Lolliginicoccus levis TaxID=2919542 RepID=UPI00241E3488|nr:TetR/AcrR family transcriptional regulator [Lolliginicoccus levis]
MTDATPAPTTSPPLRADAERNRQRIIETARELYATQGLAITLDEVARAAGVGVGTIYRRFANKHELIEALFELSLTNLAEAAEHALGNPDPWDGYRQLAEHACQRLAVDRGLSEVVIGRENDRERISHAAERMRTSFAAVFDRAHDAGALRPDATLSDLFATIHMVANFASFSGPVAPDAWRRYLALFLDSLRGDREHLPLPADSLTPEQVSRAKQLLQQRHAPPA